MQVHHHVILPVSGIETIGLGAEQNSAFCITKNNNAFLLSGFGNIIEHENFSRYKANIQTICQKLQIIPKIAVCDMHPEYISTRYAKSGVFPQIIETQHHHAHVVSCMVEHALNCNVIGVAMDGMGYGDDGTVWGGEFLLCNLSVYKRMYHLKEYKLPGGDAATLYPERMAFSYLYTELGDDTLITRILPELNYNLKQNLKQMIDNNLCAPFTSSTGRLFDAVSAILGFRGPISSPAQAAIKLQLLAEQSPKETSYYPFLIENDILNFGRTFVQIAHDFLNGIPPSIIASRFHNTLAHAILEISIRLRTSENIDKVVLSGGVFNNKFLTSRVIPLLEQNNFKVYQHKKLNPGDETLPIGQVTIALSQFTN